MMMSATMTGGRTMTDDLVTEARKGGPCAELGNRCRAIEAASGCFCAAVADRIEQLERELSISRMAQVVMDNGAEELTAERDSLRDYIDRYSYADIAAEVVRAEKAEADNARLLAIGTEMAQSIEGNYYLPGVATRWRAALNTGKEPSHE